MEHTRLSSGSCKAATCCPTLPAMKLLVNSTPDFPETGKQQQPSSAHQGSRLYLLSLLPGQHFYLVANAQERAIPLATGGGDVHGDHASSDWIS